MNNYEINLDVDPNDKYQKAKKDLIQAIQSINSLDSNQQKQLAYELIGAEKVNLFISIMQQLHSNNQK